jgi:glycosyltransferase involved in cell wall biosynthesis
MPDRRYRVLAVATHPVQYMTPIFRRMAKHPSLDFQVAYGTLRGAEASHDPAYAAADLYVSPSREDSFGMPVAEAMACGLTVITSFLAGISSLLHDGADSFVLCDPHDSETLAKLVRMLYEHPELRSRMGQAATNVSLGWTWERNAAAVWELLKDAAGKKLLSPARRP